MTNAWHSLRITFRAKVTNIDLSHEFLVPSKVVSEDVCTICVFHSENSWHPYTRSVIMLKGHLRGLISDCCIVIGVFLLVFKV